MFGALPSPGPLTAVGFSAGADLLLRMAIAHPGHFERIALLGLGDNVFEARDASTLAHALESDDEPEDVQARLFYRLAESSGNDRRALSAFIRRDRPRHRRRGPVDGDLPRPRRPGRSGHDDERRPAWSPPYPRHRW